jgi:hypothetical protein
MQKYILILAGLAIGLTITFTSIAHALPTVCQIFNGCTATSTAPTYGQMLIGGKNGEYEFVASSTVGGVNSIFGRTGAVTAQSGDYTTSLVTEGSNLYYTLARWASALAGTTTDALPEGVTNLYFTNARARGTISSTYPINYNSSTGVISTVATSSLGLTVSSFASPNISQWTNNAGYLTSLSGAASSTLLGDNNAFSGVNKFTNASSDFSGTWQTFSPSHFQIAGSYLTSSPIATSTGETAGQLAFWTSTNGTPAMLGKIATGTILGSGGITATAGQSIIGSGLTIGCTAADTSHTGCLSSGDWTTFNGKQATISATWPILFLANTVSWGGLSTTTNLVAGHVVYSSGTGSITDVATTSLGVTGPITFSGTLGAQIGGAGGNFGCTTASSGVTGCLSGTDWTTFNGKQNALTLPLTIGNGGTATSTQVTNGVNYFDGTRITSGTKLTFDGTTFGNTGITQLATTTAIVQDKGGMVFNVKAYGATGDGTTNDYTSITNAYSAASSTKGGTVYFRCGTYRTDTSIVIPNNGNHVNTIGGGMDCTTIKASAGINPVFSMRTAGTMSDLTVDGNAQAINGLAIEMVDPNYPIDKVDIVRVKARNINTSGMWVFIAWDETSGYKISELHVTDSIFEGPSNPVADAIATTYIDTVYFTNVTLRNMSRSPNFYIGKRLFIDGMYVKNIPNYASFVVDSDLLEAHLNNVHVDASSTVAWLNGSSTVITNSDFKKGINVGNAGIVPQPSINIANSKLST